MQDQQQPAPAVLKGGPLARLAGRLCQKPEFQRFAKVDSIEAAAAWVRKTCQVDSRAQLDHDNQAARRFHQLVRRPFVESRETAVKEGA